MLDDNELYSLLSACRQGTLDPSGRLKLELWADQAPENRVLLDLVTGDSEAAGQLKTLYSYDERRVWQNVRREAARRRRRRVFRAVIRTGAAAALLLGMVWSADRIYERYQQRDALVSVIEPGHTKAVLELSSGMKVALTDRAEQRITEADKTQIVVNPQSATFTQTAEPEKAAEPLINRIIVPKGGEYHLELSDGTKVWLNSESEIAFPTQFTGGTRTVELQGEAYFEVEADAAHPFVVRTDLLSVHVVGTSFNLMTYRDDPAVETTLITGSLKVVRDQAETLLEPGMQARLDKATNTLTTREVYAESYAAWARQMFVFFNEPISSICRKLARWYDVEIDASAPELDRMLYSGMIRRAEAFNKIAELLSATDELIFRERDGRIVVEKKKQ
ncbi:FecR family protein [Alistipes sp.]|uniref:FecR family protein n=1 Tax=Alistipes sp. TaxID=1872444 RepID=UPI003AF0F028